jgi:hypothetical protein
VTIAHMTLWVGSGELKRDLKITNKRELEIFLR